MGKKLRKARVFTTASQAMESPELLKLIQRTDAEIVDMEAGVGMAAAFVIGSPFFALLWCTDHPTHHSFYQQKESRPVLSYSTHGKFGPRLLLVFWIRIL